MFGAWGFGQGYFAQGPLEVPAVIITAQYDADWIVRCVMDDTVLTCAADDVVLVVPATDLVLVVAPDQVVVRIPEDDTRTVM